MADDGSFVEGSSDDSDALDEASFRGADYFDDDAHADLAESLSGEAVFYCDDDSFDEDGFSISDDSGGAASITGNECTME